MLTQHIALVPEAYGVNPSELARVSAAIRKQVTRDLAPLWGITATVDSFPCIEDVPPGYWPIILSFKRLGDQSVIHLNRNGVPFAQVEIAALPSGHVTWRDALTDRWWHQSGFNELELDAELNTSRPRFGAMASIGETETPSPEIKVPRASALPRASTMPPPLPTNPAPALSMPAPARSPFLTNPPIAVPTRSTLRAGMYVIAAIATACALVFLGSAMSGPQHASPRVSTLPAYASAPEAEPRANPTPTAEATEAATVEPKPQTQQTQTGAETRQRTALESDTSEARARREARRAKRDALIAAASTPRAQPQASAVDPLDDLLNTRQ